MNQTASPAASNSAVSLDDSQRQLVDRYGELDRKYRLWKPELDEYELLKKAIKALLDNHPAEKPAVLNGDFWQVQASMRTEESNLSSKAKAFIFAQIKKMKQVNPWDLFEISLAAAKEQLGEVAVTKLVEKLRIGSRRLTCVAMAPVEAAQKAA